MTPSKEFLAAFLAIPVGNSTGQSSGKRYRIYRSELAQGKSHKLIAHEMGGGDYISLNLYLTKNSGALLRPCEMSVQKVTEFVLAFRSDP